MKIYTIGGYNEIGKNMTAVHVGNDAVVFDAGLYLPPIVELEEREDLMHEKKLRNISAIPEDIILDKAGLRDKVRAILVSHAHLDHVGAVPYVSDRYDADVIGTPFTMAVLNTLLNDEHVHLKNRIKTIHPNSSCKIEGEKNYTADFINITHSTIQSSLICLHTKEGNVVYANDFKLDDNPILGLKPNYDKMKEVAKEGIKALIVESLYADNERKTPSEKVARALLEDVMLSTDNSKGLVVVTTFSSHIARLKSIVDFSKRLGRQPVFLGRSLAKYVNAAKETKLCPFEKEIIMSSYRKQAQSMMKKINSRKKDYVLVCTGHQGEPGSMLDRISRNETPLQLSANDHVIFSSSTIPTEINIANKGQVEKRLRQKGLRIFNDVHISGHAGREDLRDFINLLSPEHIIPAHAGLAKQSALAELASEMGYKLGKTCHVSQDLNKIEL